MLVEYVGLWREENQRIRGKPLGARRDPAKNSPRAWYRDGIQPGPLWWEASNLTTAPSLLAIYSHTPQVRFNTDTKLKAFRETVFRFQNVLKRKRRLLDISCHNCTTKLSLL